MAIKVSTNEISRLLRQSPWADVDELAQELFSLLPSLISDVTESNPLKLKSGGGLADPIQITDFGSDSDVPVLQIKRGDTIYNITYKTETGELSGSDGTTKRPTAGANVFSGTVAAYLGANFYTMTIYPNGRTAASASVTAEQLEGDPLFPHDVGRWAAVWKEADGRYAMNIPTWG